MEIPLPVVVLGTIIGLIYGLLAVGLVLIYRSNRLINFAHGEIGAFGAAIFGLITIRWHLPYWVALPVALAVAGGAGAAAEVAVVRRLRNAPRIMSVVATLGVGQFLLLFGGAINSSDRGGVNFPSPPGMPEFTIGALRVTRAYGGMLILAPLVVAGLAVFLRRSRLGIAMRVSASNPDVARMSGIFAGRMSSLAWGLAGGLSALTAILIAPTLGLSSGEGFGPSLLLRALAAAVIGGMVNLPIALLAGVGLGVVEQLVLWNYSRSGLVEVVLVVIILGALLLQRRAGGRDEEKGSWAAVPAWRPLPAHIARLRPVRNLGRISGVVLSAAALALPLFIKNNTAITLVGILGFITVGLSIGIITGLAGQLSLGQFALAAVGAVISYHVSVRSGNFALAFLYAGLGAAGASVIVGLPALRLRGLMLAVTTLAVALAVPSWLLVQPWALGDGVAPGRPIIGDTALLTGKQYYVFVLAVTVLMVILAANVRRSGFARLLVAVRDNEDNARAFTVRASLVKLQGFLIAGFIAGVGGAAYGHVFTRLGASTFPTASSVDVVVMTVIGGLGTLVGPIVGAVYYIGVPAFAPLDAAGLAATRLGALLLILYLPGGLAQTLEPLRDRLAYALARRARQPVNAETAPTGSLVTPPRLTAPRPRPSLDHDALLSARGLRKNFGGVLAVADVALEVYASETVGLIGPNGAGKTTTFEMLSGFTRPDHGEVLFDGRDVSTASPEARGRLGLIRSFQDAALFPTMTVRDTLLLSLERVAPTSFLGSALGLPGTERIKRAHVDDLIGFMGLGDYRDKQIGELSTGTRRIAELACLMALQPRLLLLDEPSSGIAQRETEALGTLLADLKRELDMTMIVIEHDIPLVMSLSDRVVAMDAGEVIAVGTPDEIRRNARVQDAYLGLDRRAIERSDAPTRARGSGGSRSRNRRAGTGTRR